MKFRLLGPLEAVHGERPLALGGRKQRALLARLLLDVNRTVAADRLIDDLWGENVPDTAAKMVQVHVSRLRKVLPAGVLVTRPPGYALEAEPDDVDVTRFTGLRAEGRAALLAGDARSAASRLHEALSLWRGPPLAEFREPFAGPEAARLEQLHQGCLEDRIEADLMLGHTDVVGELEVLIGRLPLREHLRGLLMLALYRSGRQAEALAAYGDFRRELDDQLGLEPSASLKQLERRLLRQDPELEVIEAAPERSDGPNRTRLPPGPSAEAEVRYARSGGVAIAFQVLGEGALDLVLVHGWVCSFQPSWEREQIAVFYRRLASMGRLILFDKRGTGLSDRVGGVAPLEERMDDVRAVMDAANSSRAALIGISEGGPMATLFAATYPDRTAALVLLGTFARRMWAVDYPVGRGEDDLGSREPTPGQWGVAIARHFLEERAPSVAHDEEAVRWYASYLVRGASPGAAGQLAVMNREIDVREVLPTIRVPTLVLYRAGEYLRDATRYMGERISGARIIEVPGADHLPWEGDQGAVTVEIERFLDELGDEAREPDRALATVLATRVVRPGGAEGEELARRHRALVRRHLPRFRGQELDAADGGMRASFDGPARAIRCACAVLDAAEAQMDVRAGLHTGECELVDGRPQGVAVEIAAGVAGQAGPGEALVSSTVRDLVAGSGLRFAERGTLWPVVTGDAGALRLFAVVR